VPNGYASGLPRLDNGIGFHRIPPPALRTQHEGRPDVGGVGRLHYSLSSALSAHFRRSFGASDVLTCPPSTDVPGGRRTVGVVDEPAQYVDLRMQATGSHPLT
jgi:hypothetical protein